MVTVVASHHPMTTTRLVKEWLLYFMFLALAMTTLVCLCGTTTTFTLLLPIMPGPGLDPGSCQQLGRTMQPEVDGPRRPCAAQPLPCHPFSAHAFEGHLPMAETIRRRRGRG